MPPARARRLRRASAGAAASDSTPATPPAAAPESSQSPPPSVGPESSPAPPPAAVSERSPTPPPTVASESSPAPPPAAVEIPPEKAEADVRVSEDGGGSDKMTVECEEATVAESVEEEPDEEEPESVEEHPEEEEPEEEDPEEVEEVDEVEEEEEEVEEVEEEEEEEEVEELEEEEEEEEEVEELEEEVEEVEEEDPDAEEDPEEVEEDPEEAEETDEGKGNEEDTVLAEEKAMVKVLKEGGGQDAGLESAVVEQPEEAANVDEGQEDVEEDAMEEDATEVRGEDDMNALSEVEHEKSGDEGTHGDNDKDGVACQLSAHCEVQNGELDPSLPPLGLVSVGNTKDLEIFIGGLPKDCAEEEITEIFSKFGEIVSIIVIKKKNSCIAFVRYMSTEAAKKALAEFKEGAEVTGTKVKVSASNGNNTLYLRNICKSWTKEQVLISLRSIGISEFEMILPDSPETGGQNRGITFLKFASPENAEAASQLLQKSDAFNTIDRSVKESAQTPTESSQELAMKVKTVYIEHVPLSWNDGKVEECCKAYGVIQDIHILKRSKSKTSFVEFSSRNSALACVEGINSAKIGGEVKLVASLARPRRKIQLDKKSAKGGLKVNSGLTSKDANLSIKKKEQKREVAVNKIKNSPHKLRKGDVSKQTSHVEAKVPQSSNPSKGKRKAGKTENTPVNERLPKKARKNRDVLSKPSNRTSHGGYARVAYAGASSGNIRRPAGPRYVTGNQSYPIVGAPYRFQPNARDLEPHAGYIHPENHVRAPVNHAQITYVYDQPRTAPSTIHHMDGLPYTREIAAPPPAYSGYTSNPQYQDRYAYTYLPPPRPSGSYYPGTGAYSPRRRYY